MGKAPDPAGASQDHPLAIALGHRNGRPDLMAAGFAGSAVWDAAYAWLAEARVKRTAVPTVDGFDLIVRPEALTDSFAAPTRCAMTSEL